MRTAMYMLVLGKEMTTQSPSSQETLVFYSGTQVWLQIATRLLIKRVRNTMDLSYDFLSTKRFIIDGWLCPQRDWHKSNAKSKRKSNRNIRTAVSIFFWITLLMAILHFYGIGHHHDTSPLLSISDWSSFLAITLPAWGAALHAIGKQFEYERIASRSVQMSRVLTEIIDLAENSASIASFSKVIQKADYVIGLENHEWWVLLSFNEPELAA